MATIRPMQSLIIGDIILCLECDAVIGILKRSVAIGDKVDVEQDITRPVKFSPDAWNVCQKCRYPWVTSDGMIHRIARA